ncbi:uncharacterized protein [Epargyreus clarus]|uniref:uncharacterized protein n=1 Tax=Epargyreus clarus TaxID=520877 RepID=UPI003C2DCF5C
MFDPFNPLQNIETRFAPEELEEIDEWFTENAKPLLLINQQPVDIITIEQLKQFLGLKKYHKRSFHYPSYGEIMREAEKLKAGVTKMLTRDQLIYMLDKWILEPDLKHELKLAFKVFDTEKRDFFEMEELQSIVTTYGDIFDKDETQEMLRDANVRGDGNIFYDDFVESLFSVAPELYKLQAEYLYENPDEDPSVPPDPVIEEEPPPPPPPPPPPAPPKAPPPPPPKKGK